MASFVESATLKVIDQSTGPINKINAALKKLMATAKSLNRATSLGAVGKAAATGYKQATVGAQRYTKAQTAVARAERVATAGRLMSTSQIIRAQRGLLKIERDLGTARQASTREMMRASRGTAKIMEEAGRQRVNSEKQQIKEVEKALRNHATARVQMIREAETENRRRTRTAERENRERDRALRSAAGGAGGRRPTGPGGPPGGPGGRYQAPIIGTSLDFFKGLFAANLASMVGHQLKEGLIEGTKQADVGRNKLLMMQLDRSAGLGTEGRAFSALQALAAEKSKLPGGAFLNAGQRMGIYAEALATTSLDPRGAAQATAALEELVRSGVAIGQPMEKATDQAYAFAKAADMMGRMTYQTTQLMINQIPKAGEELKRAGDFRMEGATEKERASAAARGIAPPDLGLKNFMNYMQQLQPEIGREFSGEFVRGIAKYLGATRFGVSNKAFGATLLLGEEMGTRAAVGYRQAVKQLSGIEQTKDRLANLADLDLLQGYKTGGKRPKWITTGVKDEALLKQDLPAWIMQNVGKGQGGARYSDLDRDAKKRGRLVDPSSPLAKAEKLFGRAFNLEHIEDVQALSQKLVGNSNALDTLAGHLYNGIEIQKKLAQVDKRDPEAIRKILQQSPVVAANQMKNQFEGMMGSFVVAAAPVLTPLMQQASEGFKKAGETIQVAMGPEGPERAKARMDLMSGAATAMLGAGGIALASNIVSPMIQSLGLAAGVQGLMDPKTASLAAAGLSLQAAAASLQAAAAAQMVALGGDALKKALPMLSMLPGVGAAVSAGLLIASLPKLEMVTDPAEAKAMRDLRDAEVARDATKAKRDAAEEALKANKTPPDLLTRAQLAALAEANRKKVAVSEDIAQLLAKNKERLKQEYDEAEAAHKKAVEQVQKAVTANWPFKDATQLGAVGKEPKDWAEALGLKGPQTKELWDRIPFPSKEDIAKAVGEAVRPDPVKRDRRGRIIKPPPPELYEPGGKPLPFIGTDKPITFTGAKGIKFNDPVTLTTPNIPTIGTTPGVTRFPAPPLVSPVSTTDPTGAGEQLLIMLKKAVEEGGMKPTAEDPTKTAMTDMATQASSMQAALSTGAGDLRSAAAEVGASGGVAAGALQGAAGGIGATIGSAAAAIISAAHVTVTVNAPSGGGGGKGDPGTQSATTGTG